MSNWWWVPLSIRHGPWWVRVVWRATSFLTWKPVWKLRVARRLATMTGNFCRRHA